MWCTWPPSSSLPPSSFQNTKKNAVLRLTLLTVRGLGRKLVVWLLFATVCRLVCLSVGLFVCLFVRSSWARSSDKGFDLALLIKGGGTESQRDSGDLLVSARLGTTGRDRLGIQTLGGTTFYDCCGEGEGVKRRDLLCGGPKIGRSMVALNF